MTTTCDRIGYDSTQDTLTADVRDGFWDKNPAAVYVCGVYGENHMNQFSGCGPSTAPYKFKALSVDGIIYIPNPHTRDTDKAQARQWVKAPVQPPAYAIKSAK